MRLHHRTCYPTLEDPTVRCPRKVRAPPLPERNQRRPYIQAGTKQSLYFGAALSARWVDQTERCSSERRAEVHRESGADGATESFRQEGPRVAYMATAAVDPRIEQIAERYYDDGLR